MVARTLPTMKAWLFDGVEEVVELCDLDRETVARRLREFERENRRCGEDVGFLHERYETAVRRAERVDEAAPERSARSCRECSRRR